MFWFNWFLYIIPISNVIIIYSIIEILHMTFLWGVGLNPCPPPSSVHHWPSTWLEHVYNNIEGIRCDSHIRNYSFIALTRTPSNRYKILTVRIFGVIFYSSCNQRRIIIINIDVYIYSTVVLVTIYYIIMKCIKVHSSVNTRNFCVPISRRVY
jgi:hypothetical protein